MKESGEIDSASVFALLAGAKCAPGETERPAGLAEPPRNCAAWPGGELQPALETPQAGGGVAVLASLDEACTAIDTTAASAQRLISIYTPDLEPALYDRDSFLEIVKRFVLSRSFSKVRVLVAGSDAGRHDGNRFAAMGRRLSSCIDIRHVAVPQALRACAFLIADDRAIVYRLRADTWDGIADPCNPPVARLYLGEFDSLWRESAPEDALRFARRRA